MDTQKMFMLFMLLLGIVTLVLVLVIESKREDICVNVKLKNSIRGLLILSTGMICFSTSFLICNFRCDCGESSTSGLTFTMLIFAMGLAITVLGAIVTAELKKLDGCGGSVKISPGILVMGIVMVVSAGAHMGYRVFKRQQSEGFDGLMSSASRRANSAASQLGLAGGRQGYGYGRGF
jgi:hypothetical protein